MKTTNQLIAEAQAKRLSRKYSVWFVRKTGEDQFEPYAHDSDDERTVATFMNGKRLVEECQEQHKH